ncbi:restriction endonuclease subunit S [Pseudoflavonifractor phocaeensis]|uniref:restriction endonuclease subunit S n=1 Tax=Pseudoflavonifractor phocaeensis TaxID=1870988 RepID=UPI00195AF92D|nr:restriction endonuclease subunit S [Pseudoflavonifractor phocaeensis]MBM6723719.1 restriction endonuclease subunit S [Pseudoflavonifractor phocaeensis]
MREIKDSGIEWIGEIPADWNLKKLKYTFAISSGTTPKSDNLEYWDGDIPWITPADYKTEDKYVYHGRKFLSEAGLNAANLQLVPVNSIIFSKRAPIGAVAIIGAKLAINQGCISCVPATECDIRYYYFMLSIYTEQFNLLGSGTTFKEISSKDFGNFIVPAPSVLVQEKLADYLDRKCSQIDAIIARQQEVIEKLKAYKLSVITEAVTKGLNPDVPMKDSGDDFIGVMPEHWNIAKLGMLFDFLGGYAYNSDSYTSESDNQVIRIGNVKSGYMALENNPVYISDEIASATDKFRINPGSILFTMTGTKGKRDYFFTHLVAEEDCKGKKLFLNQRVGCFIPKESIDAGYYNYLLKENRILDAIFVYETGTANQGNLGIESIRRTKVQLPSKDEQVKIREYLDNRCAKIEGLLTRKSEIICRLMAYKKSLIYEVVTGKKEV